MINKKILLTFVSVAGASLLASPVFAADANAGKAAFRANCGLCHSAEANDNGGAQGPSLIGVFGRAAASNSQYTYTSALRNSNLTWNAETLNRFLASPTTEVPGSSMVVPLADSEQRENVIAYFESLDDGSFEEPEVAAGGFDPSAFGPAAAPAPTRDADWRKDAPGRVHRIDLSELPEPYETPSAVNFPTLAERPEGAELKVPYGFNVDVFATNLEAPRGMTVAPNGDIFITETLGGRIKVMRPSRDGSKAQSISVFAQGLLQPLGIQFYPAGDNPKWLYVAEDNRVVRYAYEVGDTLAQGVPELVVAQLAPTAGGHYTRDLAFSLDGKRMFVSIGSQSNVAEDLPTKSASEIRVWEAERGVGAAWGGEESRAAVMAFEVGVDKPGKLFANGIRNCVGLTVQPETDEVWCTTNERDMLGDDLVPDYSTRVKEGGFYGWPWYYMGANEDPRHAGVRPDLLGKAIVPDVPYRAHSASVDLAFYTNNRGSSAFPAAYLGDGFAVLHGSWNRALRTGHKIVQLPMENGEPTGEYIDFMVGFITEDGAPWGRPVAIVQAKDGSLLVSDDGANIVYRISYSR